MIFRRFMLICSKEKRCTILLKVINEMGRVKFILTVFLTYFVVSGKFVLCSCFNYADHNLGQCFKDELVVSYMLLLVWGWL